MSQPPGPIWDPQPGQDPHRDQPAPQHDSPGGYAPMGGSAPAPGQAPYPGGQRQGGGGMFPLPHTTWRTRRGSTVTVGGCCLPLPIGCLTTVLAAGVVAATVVSSRRAA